MSHMWINYQNREKEKVDLARVMQYHTNDESAQIDPGVKIEKIGCGLDYIVDSLFRGKAIFISKIGGEKNEDGIERIINSNIIKSVRLSIFGNYD
jgi:hypothetical protein